MCAVANATGPSVSADLPFVFPRECFVAGLMVIPNLTGGALGVPAMQAALALACIDENQEALVSDGRGSQFTTSTGALASVGADALLLNGLGFRPFPLQRPARTQARWIFNVQNRVTSTVQIAGIYIFTEDPHK